MAAQDDDLFAHCAVQTCLSVARSLKHHMDSISAIAEAAHTRRRALGPDDEGFAAFRGASFEITTALREFLKMLEAAQNPKPRPEAH